MATERLQRPVFPVRHAVKSLARRLKVSRPVCSTEAAEVGLRALLARDLTPSAIDYQRAATIRSHSPAWNCRNALMLMLMLMHQPS